MHLWHFSTDIDHYILMIPVGFLEMLWVCPFTSAGLATLQAFRLLHQGRSPALAERSSFESDKVTKSSQQGTQAALLKP